MYTEFPSTGTTWRVEVFDKKFPKSAMRQVVTIADDFERKYTRFSDASLVGQLNNRGILEGITEELYEMLEYAENIFTTTLGHFDIRVGSIMESIGYDKNYSFQESKIKGRLRDKFIDYDENKIKLIPGEKIDLGGMGKGWLVDKIASFLKEAGAKYFVINAGGDIYTTSEFGKPITASLESPFDERKSIGKVKLYNSAIACSAANRRKWKNKHHLVSPRSGGSKSGVAAVFTQAPTALAADVSSTSIFVSNHNIARSIRRVLKAEYLILYQDGKFTHSQGYKVDLNSPPEGVE